MHRFCKVMPGIAKFGIRGICYYAYSSLICCLDGDQIFRLKTLRLKTFRLKKNSRKSLGNANFRPAKRVRPAQRLEKPHLKVRLG